MLIKQLKLLGFKSFVDQTELNFEPGITGIVGPNGCGKSNVSDAIRWVLGEQNAKHLRGNRMDDLIFNGSEDRKPVGMASVSITFSGIQGRITHPEFSAYDEITVTRRLFRTGESEYLINNNLCRLKDVVDLFLDTGISTRSYSILEQGQVAKIVNSKPEDRRMLIEEAAGIVKYKIRRHEALNKLELTAQNLARVGDILRELERQMNSLKRQAGKAERYKSFKSELREKSLAVFSQEFHQTKNRISESKTDLGSKKDFEVSLSARVASTKGDLEVMRQKILHKEREISGQKEEQVRIQGRIHTAEENLEILKDQTLSLRENLQKAGEELEQFAHDQQDLTRQIEESGETEIQLQSVLEETKSLFARKNEGYLDRKSQVEDMVSRIEEAERKSTHLLDQISRRENSLSSIRTRNEMLGARSGKIAAERGHAETQKTAVTERHAQLMQRLRSVSESLSARRSELESESAGVEEGNKLLEENEKEGRKLHEEIASEKAHLNSLQELDRTFQGYSDGIKVLMEAKAANGGGLSGVGGVLVEVLNTAKEYEVAVESVLSDKLQGVVVENHGVGVSALRMLKEKSIGKQTFIPLSPRIDRNDSPADFPSAGIPTGSGARPEGVIGDALSLVGYPKEYEGIFRYLLKDVLIVRDIETAVSLWETSGNGTTLVTLEGEIVDRGGMMVGGPGKNSGGLLERKRLIHEIGERLELLNRRFEEFRQRAAELKERRDQAVSRVREIETTCREIELELVRGEHDGKKEQHEMDRILRHLETLDAERAQVDMEMDSLSRDREKLGSEISELSGERERILESLRNRKEELVGFRRDLDSSADELRQIEVRITEIAGNLANHRNETARLKKARADLVLRSEKRQKERVEMEEKVVETEKTMENLRNEVVSLSARNDDLLGHIRGLSEKLEEKNTRLSELEARAGELEQSHHRVKDQIHELGIRLTEMRLQTEHLLDKARSEFVIEPVEIEQYPLETLTDQLLEEEIRPRIDFLRDQIVRIGEVNLSAIEEYTEVAERHGFMSGQQKDLLESSQALKETIDKISRTTRHRFEETFHQVNENFKNNFRRLFNGGRAELVLVDQENLLESGVDIIVQPPGKKAQNLNLLSMGEKSMVAITLLFSMFMVRTSPFCLLDEVDAALDEANVVRFREIIEELRGETQFMVITHNQKTMSFVDRLYGVTMEQSGVSRILSLRLKEAVAYAAA